MGKEEIVMECLVQIHQAWATAAGFIGVAWAIGFIIWVLNRYF